MTGGGQREAPIYGCLLAAGAAGNRLKPLETHADFRPTFGQSRQASDDRVLRHIDLTAIVELDPDVSSGHAASIRCITKNVDHDAFALLNAEADPRPHLDAGSLKQHATQTTRSLLIRPACR